MGLGASRLPCPTTQINLCDTLQHFLDSLLIVFGLFQKLRYSVFGKVPECSVIYNIIAVGNDIAEADYLSIFGNLS